MRGELSAHVVVSRGRLGVYAADTFDELGRGDAGTDWLAAQEPGVDLLLLGLPTGDGHPLPVEDEVRATSVGSRSTIVTRPGSTEVVDPPASTAPPAVRLLGTVLTRRPTGRSDDVAAVAASGPLTRGDAWALTASTSVDAGAGDVRAARGAPSTASAALPQGERGPAGPCDLVPTADAAGCAATGGSTASEHRQLGQTQRDWPEQQGVHVTVGRASPGRTVDGPAPAVAPPAST